jgi:phosphatidate cytidylyltransferase
MAFNWATFKTRTLTAIIFAVVVLGCIGWNKWTFLLLFSVIHFGCWHEFLKLAEKIHQTRFHPYTRLGFMLMGYGLMLLFCDSEYQISGYSLRDNISLPVSAAGFAILIIGIFQKTAVKMNAFGMAVLGLLYISLSWGLMMDLYQTRQRSHESIRIGDARLMPLVIIAAIWINDTMAYIVGSLIGKTPLSAISPKKTWEGTIGGIILSVVVVGLALRYIEGWGITVGGAIALIAAVMGTLGDLLESKLKRMAGVKDSGSIMPGHGGFLDRFDSLLIATPFVWLYVYLVF